MSKGLRKFLLGAGIGTCIGVIFSNKTTREQLKIKIDDLIDKAKNIDSKDVLKNIINKVEDIKTGISELDKDKVLKTASEKANSLINKLEELVKYTKEKGTPVLEKSANVVKEKAIVVIKQILKKLEQEES